MESFDHCIIGAGVIGLATAYKLSQQNPSHTILLIEAHSQFGIETSSRNSEVIHAGIYYPQNSLKAELCLSGKKQLYTFCQQHDVQHKSIGKLIIANSPEDIHTLETLHDNAKNNGLNLSLLTQAQCLTLEPNVKAKAGLYSSSTGILDSHSYMQTLLRLSEQQGVLFSPNTSLIRAEKEVHGFILQLDTHDGEYSIRSRNIINSAGLHAPTVASTIDALKANHIPRYHYCRGHYYSYQGKNPFSHLIYPVPSKQTEGLGIHATIDMAGQVRFGPDTQFIESINYDISPQEELYRKELFYNAIKQYFPNVALNKLHASYSGIRPKLSAKGEKAKDFIIQTKKDHSVCGLINLYGIESPGLTASLAIADFVCSEL